jgi:hypothetical protein
VNHRGVLLTRTRGATHSQQRRRTKSSRKS